MLTICLSDLQEIKTILKSVDSKYYSKPIPIINGTSIGHNIRIIIQNYQAIKDGADRFQVKYSQPKDQQLENDLKYAIKKTKKLEKWLESIENNYMLTLIGSYSNTETEEASIASSLFRELAHCLDHSHHQKSIIKLGLIELNTPAPLAY